MWVLGQTQEIKEAKDILKTNISGEYSTRTLPIEIYPQGEHKNDK
jgi:hypothetical protein